jgi:hypothetical protein
MSVSQRVESFAVSVRKYSARSLSSGRSGKGAGTAATAGNKALHNRRATKQMTRYVFIGTVANISRT